MAKEVFNFKNLAIFAVAVMAFVSCNKSKIIPENPAQEQEMENNTPKHPSQNASWTGWANANKNEIQAYQEKVLQYAMILSQTPEVKNLIKDYFTSNLGNSNFSYSINIEQLINLCSANGGQAMSRTITPAIQCGLISDSTKFGDLLNEMKGKTIGGRTITPEIYIPYYDTSLFVTPTWDGATVNRIVLNDIYAKKNVGVPVKVWNGSTFTLNYYQKDDSLNRYVHWIIQLTVPDNLNPIAKCTCVYSTPSGGTSQTNHCVLGGQIGNPLCKLTIQGSCEGNCNIKRYID
jgi:hypothetical protein